MLVIIVLCDNFVLCIKNSRVIVVVVRFLKKGMKLFLVGKKEVSNIIVIRVKVKGLRI